MNQKQLKFLYALAWLVFPSLILAAESSGPALDLKQHWVGYVSILIFVLAYILVMSEEVLHLRKSKAVVVSAGIIWLLIAGVYGNSNLSHLAEQAVRHNILEFAELMLFLLVAMTYVNTLLERHVFEALRYYLVSKNLTLRQLFWLTGIIAFFLSPIADNLTTALVMCAVILAVGGDNNKFVLLGCINVVVAANAGGAFSPFGDITTLMVWQKGLVSFTQFFALVIPSIVNFLVVAGVMQFAVPKEKPNTVSDKVEILPGGITVIFLFLATIITAVSAHSFFHLPPVLGMMLGLGYLMFYSYWLKIRNKKYKQDPTYGVINIGNINFEQNRRTFDPFHRIAGAEWDTLLFFFGVILSVGGIGFIGYLSFMSEIMYLGWGPTWANIMVGVLSALIDNIPVMFAVLTMNPDMSLNQWLLATLTAGIGGSMLSIGSAAGVALMGQSKGKYTFLGHLRWSPLIVLSYVASILTHIAINGLD